MYLNYIIFFTISYLLLSGIVKGIFFSDRYARKKMESLDRIGVKLYMLKHLIALLFYILSFYYTYKNYEFKIIWLIMTILFIIMVIAAIVALLFVKNPNKPASLDIRIERYKKNYRIALKIYIVILILWVYTWRSLFL